VIRAQVSSGIAAVAPLSTSETVAWETPAAFATSFWVARAMLLLIRIIDTYQ
jgi:hypothetical protein